LDILVWLALVAVLLLGALGIVALVVAARRRPDAEPGQYPKGHFVSLGISMGIAIGSGVGVALGLALQTIALGFAIGPAIGVALGAAIGTEWERRNQDKIRPLTANVIRVRRMTVIVGAVILAVGLGALVLTYMLVSRP